MAVTLPHHFDTTATARLMLSVSSALFCVLALGTLWTLLIRHDLAGAVALLLTAGGIAYFWRLFHRHLEGIVGTISRSGISVRPGEFLGLKLKGLAGEFPLSSFTLVRVEVSRSMETLQECGRVILAGKSPTPDIQITTLSPDDAKHFGAELAERIGLPLEVPPGHF